MGFCLFRPLRSSSLPSPAIRHRRGGPAVRASLLLLLALPCRAGAQHPTDTLAVDGSYDIEEIVVTARRATEIIPTQKLEGKALEELNSHSVADALRYFSGIQIKDYGGIGGLKTVNIRSMGSQHVGVFFDGIQIGNAQNGTVDLGRFSLDNMEAISVYNGQKSSIFQSAKDFASASALYMETRRPRFDSIRTDNFKATLKGGSFKTVNPSLLWEHKFGRRIRSSLNTEYMYTSGEYRFSYAKADGYDTTEVRKNGDVRLFRAEAALFGDLDDGEWRAKAYFYDSERGYPGYIDRNIPDRIRNQDRQWDTNFFLQGSLTRKPLPFYTFFIKGKYAYDYLHYFSDEEDSMYIDNRYHQQEAYVSSAHMFSIFPWWSANLSVDAQWNRLEADLVDFVYPKRYTVLAAAATSLQPHLRTGKPALHPCDRYHEMERNGSRSQERIHPHSHRLLETPPQARPLPAGILQAHLPHADIQRPLLHRNREQKPETGIHRAVRCRGGLRPGMAPTGKLLPARHTARRLFQ